MGDPVCTYRAPDEHGLPSGERCRGRAAFALIDAHDPDLVDYACEEHRAALTQPQDRIVHIRGAS